VGSDGELWIPPFYRLPMSTVLICTHTSEGFVIASDGRSTDPESHRILSDDVQKIFPVEYPGGCLTFCLAGIIRIASFDFRTEAARVAKELADGKPKNWYAYTEAFMVSLCQSLTGVRQASTEPLVLKETDTWMFLGGFYGKNEKTSHIHFQHGSLKTEAEPYLYPPNAHAWHFGSPKIFDLLEKQDVRFSKYGSPTRDDASTLSAAIDSARNYISAHCDPEALKEDEAICSNIGGRVQIATITRARGFKWVPGFEANPQPPLSERIALP
jgi:hypothetical protein